MELNDLIADKLETVSWNPTYPWSYKDGLYDGIDLARTILKELSTDIVFSTETGFKEGWEFALEEALARLETKDD